ncbi:MAG: M23 family metallopeptidase [Spirochaetales bacterium]|nr:M23 family metallopeptidase [Spirochaetales bacterium]
MEKRNHWHPDTIRFCIVVFFLNVCPFLFPEYFEIKSLTSDDPLFIQLQNDISRFYKAKYRRKESEQPKLVFFQYSIGRNDDIFTISARLNLPYDALASLNRFLNPDDLKARRLLIIPNQPGIFLSEADTRNELEELMSARHQMTKDYGKPCLVNFGEESIDMVFFPGDRFHAIERAFFLRIIFTFPLERGRLTSSFGMRIGPITGKREFHGGIDLAAPIGTKVFAANKGKVTKIGTSRIYGKFIIITHSNGYQTLYGHLNKVLIRLNQTVNSGMIIGEVGTTGRSTGPHLHFELLKNGKAVDPESKLKK